MKRFVRIQNVALGMGLIVLFAFNLYTSLLQGFAPRYEGPMGAGIQTALLLWGGLIQVQRFAFRLHTSMGGVAVSLLLLGAGMLVDLYVWGSVVFGFAIPHAAPQLVIAGYWATFYVEVVWMALAEYRAPGGILAAKPGRFPKVDARGAPLSRVRAVDEGENGRGETEVVP